jgi:hypothetical protein
VDVVGDRGGGSRPEHGPFDQRGHASVVVADPEHDPLALPRAEDDPLARQRLEVSGGARLGQADAFGELGHARFPGEQRGHDAETRTVAQAGQQASHP